MPPTGANPELPIAWRLERRTTRIHCVRNHCILYLFAVLALLGCKPRPQANTRHVSVQVFEVVDCTANMFPKNVRGSSEKYCLSVEPVVDTADIRGAEVLHGETGTVRLVLYITLKAGQRLQETTGRIAKAHLDPGDPGRLAIVVDGVLVSAPGVRGVISDSIVIEGAFSWDEAMQIADSINGRR